MKTFKFSLVKILMFSLRHSMKIFMVYLLNASLNVNTTCWSQPRWLSWMRVRLVIRRLRVWSPPGQQHSFVKIDHEIFSTAFLSLPLIQEGQLLVSGERMCTILVNRWEVLALRSKSVVRGGWVRQRSRVSYVTGVSNSWAYSWARSAILAAGKGRVGGFFYAPAYSKNSGRALSVTPVRPVRTYVRPSSCPGHNS